MSFVIYDPLEHNTAPLETLDLLLRHASTYEQQVHSLHAYCNIVEVFLEPNAAPADKHGRARKIWNRKFPTPMTSGPGWTSVWAELQCRRSDFVKEALHFSVVFKGLRLQYFVAYILGLIDKGYGSRYQGMLKRLVAQQPMYVDLPSNIDQIQDTSRKDPFHFSEVGKALAPFHQDTEALSTIVGQFSIFIALVCDVFRKTAYAPSNDTIEALKEWAVIHYSIVLSQPFSEASLEVRTHMCKVNIRGIFDFLVAKARSILHHSQPQDMSWQLFFFFVQWTLLSAGSRVNDALRRYYTSRDLGHFMDGQGCAKANYIPAGLENTEVPAVIIPQMLQDVSFEAIGPRINVAAFTTPTTFWNDTCGICLEEFEENASGVVKVVCGHAFHLDCLDDLVNGILPTSNKCTFCRKEICPSRQRQAISSTLSTLNEDEDNNNHGRILPSSSLDTR